MHRESSIPHRGRQQYTQLTGFLQNMENKETPESGLCAPPDLELLAASQEPEAGEGSGKSSAS